jgi:hypothetical protein
MGFGRDAAPIDTVRHAVRNHEMTSPRHNSWFDEQIGNDELIEPLIRFAQHAFAQANVTLSTAA